MDWENTEELHYIVFNIEGRRVHTGSMQPKINLSNLITGVYILEIKSKYQVAVQRFVKL
jgi:hypothetical protein